MKSVKIEKEVLDGVRKVSEHPPGCLQWRSRISAHERKMKTDHLMLPLQGHQAEKHLLKDSGTSTSSSRAHHDTVCVDSCLGWHFSNSTVAAAKVAPTPLSE
eukprot:gnl/TRDRNA2_/TRDRNA2_150049_c0_seq1.p1 gnl/TRDRNA2_/TRDRNA2_150049_c0~~gnl/TRDRNA2_/TRDRNA2_150049_c0_seq1.p1  ORF type:complete len:102 (+),score=6.25 gnl/TRDRNA2_/TRDRNA2_150049_c0_seq1:142-447(+)